MADPWAEIRRRTLARQFPAVRKPASVAAVAELLDRIGPIQSQTARSTFLGLAARAPGVSNRTISDALRRARLLRGSVIRGTVHTGTPTQLAVLDRITRIGQRREWERRLTLQGDEVHQLWASLETFAENWRSVDELTGHLHGWLRRHRSTGAVPGSTTEPRPEPSPGMSRYLAFGHGGLIRRPSNDDWAGQAAAEYRHRAAVLADHAVTGADAAASVIDDAAAESTVPQPDPRGGDNDPVRVAILLHLRAHGPASRRDLAWWSGLGLTVVDAAIAALLADGRIERVDGPGSEQLFDVPGAPSSGGSRRRVRLLPEFDALLCGYHPAGRGRFVGDDEHRRLWNQNNGLVLPPVLIDGRIGGYWRAGGSAKVRPLQVVLFDSAPDIDAADVASAAGGIEAALDITVDDVTVVRDRDLPG